MIINDFEKFKVKSLAGELIDIHLSPTLNVEQESILIDILKLYGDENLNYILTLLDNGYISDEVAHNNNMNQISSLYPFLCADKEYNDSQVMELLNSIISKMEFVFHKSIELSTQKKVFLEQMVLSLIQVTPSNSVILENVIMRRRVIAHALVFWLKRLIKQINQNLFDFEQFDINKKKETA